MMRVERGQGALRMPAAFLRSRKHECSGRELLGLIQQRCGMAVLAANVIGALLVFVLSVYVLPAPDIPDHAGAHRANLIAFAVTLPLLIVAGGIWVAATWKRVAGWLTEERAPTPEERDATIRYPVRLVRMELVLWAIGGAVFVLVNLPFSTRLAAECAVQIAIGAVTTCALAYLLDERLSRPIQARALELTPMGSGQGPQLGVRARLGLVWAVGALVPLVTLIMVGCSAVAGDVMASHTDIGYAVIALGAVGVAVGLVAITIATKTLSDPLLALRGALARVEGGDLDARVQVDDASEVGMLQAGFNRMVHGLRERDRLRDLLGRQVGEEVAREALEAEDVELGGETREAAVLFVDLIGSTSMAMRLEPEAVVSELNRFFALVVDCVSLHGGWVNKFEGDAALCVFGAPASHPDPAGAALATARTLHGRLDSELPHVRAAIGVSAGVVVAGNVGTAERYEYTVIGDPVNEAARLTELAKSEPARLLASDAALDRARNGERERWRTGREVTLRGRERPTVVAAPA
jgi:adenylate cyclase